MMKHTPAPWTLQSFATTPNRRILGPRAPADIVADVYGGEGEHDGNAQILAAAPDTYRELKKARVIVEKWIFYQGDHPDLATTYLDPIDAAIAKAEGRDG